MLFKGCLFDYFEYPYQIHLGVQNVLSKTVTVFPRKMGVLQISVYLCNKEYSSIFGKGFPLLLGYAVSSYGYDN